MVAIRAPFSAVGGVLCSVALFLCLAQLVNVPFELGPTIVAEPILFKPARIDTPVETKRKEKVERTPPVLPPDTPKGVGRDGETIETIYDPPPPTVTIERDRGRAHGVDGDVVPIVRPNPAYPAREAYRGIEGWVLVQFSVTSIGTVRDAAVVDAEPRGVFDEAALAAIARWRYQPRVVNGEAVERVGLQTVIRFELED